MSREHEQGMSVIVKTITRLTVGLILLYGIYILSHGHLSPGGGLPEASSWPFLSCI